MMTTTALEQVQPFLLAINEVKAAAQRVQAFVLAGRFDELEDAVEDMSVAAETAVEKFKEAHA